MITRKGLFLLIIVGLLTSPWGGMATPAVPIAAAHTLSDDPGPGYNPNNLISNDNFTGYGMDGSGVNAFLQSKGSWLKNYSIPEYQDVPFKYRDGNGNCVWNTVSTRQFYDRNQEALYGTSAGDLIAKETHVAGINPQVILATLEKESSAISLGSPQSNPVQMWVLGYGWNDTMAGCGYDYDTARARAINFGGVGQQLTYASLGLRTLYNQSTDWGQPFNTVDGVTVTAANQATRALFRYTPYVHNGNHNFWHFFTIWFQTIPIFNPPAYGIDEEGRPDIVFNGARWPLTDMDTFHQYLPSVTPGPLSPASLALPRKHMIGRLIRKGGDGRIFYVINGIRRHVNSERVLNLYGWRMEDVVGNVDDTLIDAIPVGDPMLPIIRMENNSTTYLLTRGENHRIDSQSVFQDNWKFDWGEVIEVPPYVVNTRPTSNSLGLIAVSNEGTPYLIDKGRRYNIPDNSTAERWGLNWNTAVRFDTLLLSRFPEDHRLTPYARDENGNVYVLEHGQRRWVSPSRLKQLNISNDIVDHGNAFLHNIPEGSHY